MAKFKALTKLLAATAAAGITGALALTPIAAIGGVAVDRTNTTMQSNLQDLTSGTAPGVTTILDKNDDPIAWLYDQRRFSVPANEISSAMKNAIVAIEDRRFYEHNGVDIQGNLRAMATNLLAGGVEQGASTINQQYVKNYLLLVLSDDAEDQAAAIETSIPRKLREMRMASEINDHLSKDEILARYLNLIPFGNGAYGVEAAARTYFGTNADKLTVLQSAMLAGMVQSSSYLNPYTNAQAVKDRRNAVLDAMASTGSITAQEAAELRTEPLGVLDEPRGLPNGCISAGNAGFFCDYVLEYLAEKGLSQEQLTDGTYTIRTTLDPAVQESTHSAVTSQVSAQAPGAAEVVNVVEPGRDSRNILAMASSRDYGLDLDAGQTVLPQTTALVGNGAGSVFKIFTAAAALQQGYGLNTTLQVPARYEARGMGDGGARNCPANTYCVENAGSYAPTMTLKNALAQSPNTTFVQLIEKVGVKNVVDISVKLGLRSYLDEGSFNGEDSIADYVTEHNLGSYTLGPTPVSALELSNVAASLASDGRWCEPNPVREVTDQDGNEVFIDRPDCEQALDADVARALADGMTADIVSGTGATAARAANWSGRLAAKTGTTESHQSAAFMGFNDQFAAATYIYNDGTQTMPLCTSPLRQCANGDLYGGYEPARTWFAVANGAGGRSGTVPQSDPKFKQGATAAFSAKYRGRNGESVRKELASQGYQVNLVTAKGDGLARGAVMRIDTVMPLSKDSPITIWVSDGTSATPPASPSASPSGRRPDPAPPATRPDPQQQLNDLRNRINQLLGGAN
ncbi:transglycosylase domain-containing protein [Corynebacterium sp. ZY180755]